jgi:hypothetical protein
MKQEFQHQSLAAGRWFTFSLAEQLSNVGSEVGRAVRAKEDTKRFEGAIFRAFELLDLTISDIRWRKRLKELTRLRELFCDAVLGGTEYGTSLEDLDKYFYHFTFASRANR